VTAAAITAAILLLGSITGCALVMENSAGPLAIRRDGDLIQIAVCKSINAAGLKATERADAPSDWMPFWEFSRDISVAKGDILSQANSTELGVDQGSPPALDIGEQMLVIVLDATGDNANPIAADFELDSPLRDDVWLHPDGTVTEAPCE
jgi:hypothetical protein